MGSYGAKRGKMPRRPPKIRHDGPDFKPSYCGKVTIFPEMKLDGPPNCKLCAKAKAKEKR